MASALGITGVVVPYSEEASASHYNEREHRAKYSNAKEVYYEDCEDSAYPDRELLENSGISLVYFSTFENNAGEVLHHFGTSGQVGTRWRETYPNDGDWEEVRAVAEARLNVWNLDNRGSLLAPQEGDQRMVGATPEDNGTEYNYDEAAYTALKEVISGMHPAIQAVVGAHNIVDALKGHEQDVRGQRVEYSWDYSSWSTGDTANASNFCRFYIETDKSYNEFDVQVESNMDSLPSPSCPKKYYSDDNTWAALRLKIEDPKIESQQDRNEVAPESLPAGIPEEFKEKGPIMEYQENVKEVNPEDPPGQPKDNSSDDGGRGNGR